MKKQTFLSNRVNKYSIRKFKFGAASVLIGSLLFLGNNVQAAEEPVEDTNILLSENNIGDEEVNSIKQVDEENQEPSIFSEELPNVEEDGLVNQDSEENQESLAFAQYLPKTEEASVNATRGNISDQLNVTATLDVKDRVHAVGGKHGDLGYTNFDFTAEIPLTAKEGDYFDVYYEPALSVSPVNPNDVTNGRDPITGIQRGVRDRNTGELIAEIEDYRDQSFIRYILTNYVERKSNVKINQRYTHAYDYENAPNSGNYTVGYTIGDKEYKKNVYIDYANNQPSMKNGYGVSNVLYEVIDSRDYTNISYFNPTFNQLQSGTYGLIYPFKTSDSAINPMEFEKAKVTIYEVSEGNKLNESHYFVPEEVNAVDVTNDVNLTFDQSSNGWRFDLINPNKSYVAVTKGKARQLLPGEQGEFVVGSEIGNVHDYNTTARMITGLVVIGQGASGEGTDKPGAFFENHIYYDKVLTFEGELIPEKTEVKEVLKQNESKGTEDEKFNTSPIPDGYKWVQTTPSSNMLNQNVNDDGSIENQNYIPGETQYVTYSYEKVKQPGRFKEAHHYHIVYVDEDGNPVDKEGNPVEAG
ncbi:YSIRK-type signal peptide-containing protein, partial [Falseniella ignava]